MIGAANALREAFRRLSRRVKHTIRTHLCSVVESCQESVVQATPQFAAQRGTVIPKGKLAIADSLVLIAGVKLNAPRP